MPNFRQNNNVLNAVITQKNVGYFFFGEEVSEQKSLWHPWQGRESAFHYN